MFWDILEKIFVVKKIFWRRYFGGKMEKFGEFGGKKRKERKRKKERK